MARPGRRGQRGLTETETEEDGDEHVAVESTVWTISRSVKRLLLTLRATERLPAALAALCSPHLLPVPVPCPRPAPIPAVFCPCLLFWFCIPVRSARVREVGSLLSSAGSGEKCDDCIDSVAVDVRSFRSAAALTGIDSLPAVRRNQKVQLQEEERPVLLRVERLAAQRDESAIRFPTTRSVSDDHLCQQTSLPHRLPHTSSPLLVRTTARTSHGAACRSGFGQRTGKGAAWTT